MITDNELAQIMPNLPADKRALYLPFLQAAMNEFQINTYLREAAFLAQLAHESMELKAWSENLNYSAQALLNVFPKYFKTSAQANAYARQPEKIANRVYASRMGNGDEASGDGWRYRGRGPIQLTGKNNYQTFGQTLGLNLVANPDQAATPEVGFRTAGAFWVSRNLNALADRQDFVGITRAINGGTNGLEDRQKYYNRAKQVLSRDDAATRGMATRGMADDRGGGITPSVPSDLSRGILPGAPETIEMFGGTHDPVRGAEEAGGAGGGAQKGGAKKGAAQKGAGKRSTGKASQAEEPSRRAGKGGAKKGGAKKAAAKKSAAKGAAKKASKKGGGKSSAASTARKGAGKKSAGKSAAKRSAAGKGASKKGGGKKGGGKKGGGRGRR